MRTVFFILSLFLGLSVYAQQEEAPQPKKTFYFQKKSAIAYKADYEVLSETEIQKGKKLVFYYEWQSPYNKMVPDLNRTDKLYFELTPKQARSFRAEGEALKKVNTIRCRICFCPNGGCRITSEGVLTVKRAGNNRYNVTFTDNPETGRLLVNETFTLKKAE